MDLKRYIDSLITRSVQRYFFDDNDSSVKNRVKDLLAELDTCSAIIPKFGKKMDKKIGKIRYLFSIDKPREACQDLLELRKSLKKLSTFGSLDIDESVFLKAIATIDSLVELSINIG